MMWNLHIWLVLFCSALSRAGGVEDPCLHHAVVGAPLQRQRDSHLVPLPAGFAFGFMAVIGHCPKVSGLSASH